MPKAIHTMLRVLDEARSAAFYRAAFGLEIADRMQFTDFTLVYLRNEESPFEVELTINHQRREPYQLGAGYGHLAFSVDDIAGEHARLASLGLEPGQIKALDYQDLPIASFFFIEDPDGYKIEVLQRRGRYV